MSTKFFKKIYSDYTGYGKWEDGDAINYNPTSTHTVEEIAEAEYNTGIANLVIPKTKEQLIAEKNNELAVIELKKDGKLDANGDLVKQ